MIMKPAIVILSVLFLFSVYTGFGGELSPLSKKEVLTVHGNTGVSFSFNNSNRSTSGRPPVDWNIAGDYSARVFGVDLPFSFTISQNFSDYTHPFKQFGINPSFKWARVYLGKGNILLSPLFPAGYDFKGAGVELTPGKFRFSAFWGKLKTENHHDMAMENNRNPWYSGYGYGIKIGTGSADNFIDLSYFHGKDESSPDHFIVQRSVENEMIGMDYRFRVKKILSFSGNIAVSGSGDEQPESDASPAGPGPSSSKYRGVFSTYHSGNIPPWALEAAFSIDLKNFRSLLSYHNERADFRTINANTGKDYGQTISLSNSLYLAKGKASISTFIMHQSNDQKNETSAEADLFFSAGKHVVTGTLNYRSFCYKNDFIGGSVRNMDLSASLHYDWQPGEYSSFSLAAMYNHFDQAGSTGSAMNITMNAGTSVLRNRSLNLNGSLACAVNKYDPGGSGTEFLLSFNAGYQPGRNSFRFFLNYSLSPNDIKYSTTDYLPYKTSTYGLTAGASYSSSF
jgi:hypothetical protein